MNNLDRFKFRAWDVDNKHMFYKTFNDWEKTKVETHDFLKINLEGKIERYYEGNDGITYSKEQGNYTLMQSTGLKDKNGKLIFEGDIVKDTKDQQRYKIFYREIAVCFSLEILGIEDFDCRDFGEVDYQGIEDYLEVIGNIYENPELLTISDFETASDGRITKINNLESQAIVYGLTKTYDNETDEECFRKIFEYSTPEIHNAIETGNWFISKEARDKALENLEKETKLKNLAESFDDEDFDDEE